MDLASFANDHSESRIVIKAGGAWHSIEIDGHNALTVENGSSLSEIGLHIEDLDELDVEDRADLREALGGRFDSAYKMPLETDDDDSDQ